MNSFYGSGSAEPFAVGQDGVTILTLGAFGYNVVDQVSGQTGQIGGSLAVQGLGGTVWRSRKTERKRTSPAKGAST
jgi:hypothetical protein